MNTSPLFSVVIPLYNMGTSVGRALQSVLAQTLQDCEIIVINDGSTDNGKSVVAAYTDSRIRLLDQPNAGVSAARNHGIREAHSEWVAFLDADDIWLPDHLETLSELQTDYPDASICATSYFYVPEVDRTNAPIIAGLPPEWRGLLTDYFALAARSDPPLGTSATAARTNALKSIGGFPIGVTSGEDLLTWARLAVTFQIAYTMKPTAHFISTGYIDHNRPNRCPDRNDVVGLGLKALLNTCKPEQRPGLRQYISMWHKMRASMLLRSGERWDSVTDACRGIRYDPLQFKLYTYLILALLPTNIITWAFRLYRAKARRLSLNDS